MPKNALHSGPQAFLAKSCRKKPVFGYTGRHVCNLGPVNVSTAHGAVSRPRLQKLYPSHKISHVSERHTWERNLCATTTAEQSRSTFTYSAPELSAMAEEMLDGEKQGISAQDLLTGLATSEARGLADTSEQASERRRRFGVNKLPSRKEVRSYAYGRAVCRGFYVCTKILPAHRMSLNKSPLARSAGHMAIIKQACNIGN